MKTSKYLTAILAAAATLLMSQGACRGGKFLNREKISSSETHLNISDAEKRTGELSRVIQMNSSRDSTDLAYRINIFPLDTFKFSLQKGFEGKAYKVEISGDVSRIATLRMLKDYAGLKADCKSDRLISTGKKISTADTRVLEKQKVKWPGILLIAGLGVLVMIVVLWRKGLGKFVGIGRR